MKIILKILLSVLFILSTIQSIACSCSHFDSFCTYYTTEAPNDFIASGIIIDTSNLYIRLKLIDRFRGIESRDTIKIWNDADYCNGVRMKASDIGNPGDSILIAIPRIDSIVNTWDVLGDYRRPNWYCIQSSLLIKNDTLSGLLKGIYFSGGPIATNIDKYSYPKFKLNWVQSVIHDCNTVVGVIEKFINESINIFPNPTLNNLNVQINNFSRIQDIQVFNLLGKEHKISWTEDNKTKATINTVAWPKGVYLIQVKTNEGIVSKKIVKS